MPGCKLEVWDKGDGQEQVLFSRKKDLILGWMEQALTKITLMIALSFHIPCSRLQRRRKSLQMLATSGIIRTGAHQTALNKRKLLNNGKDAFDDRYNRNKLVFTATGKPHWVEELNDDFDDMDEDIESYRCTCN